MRREAKAYAKINLGLLIHGKRDDGYHEIETVFHRIDLADTLVFEPADEINLSTSSSDIPADESNLCWKAASMLNDIAGGNRGVRITLMKNIPVGAGLGGGSSDAACVLRVLPRLWNIQVSQQTLADAANRLGSDVAFFLGTDSAHGTGRGEKLNFFRLALPFALVVCYPGVHVATPWAYSQIRSFRIRDHGILGERIRENVGKPDRLCRFLENDFEAAVFAHFPEIVKARDRLLEAGALCVALSGSGSSVYGIFADDRVARRTADSLRTNRVQTFFTASGFQPSHVSESPVS
jgi:4-diphosphocytidyl-2-C-methyl-D-erythritol kinase